VQAKDIDTATILKVNKKGFEVDVVLCSDADNNCVCLHKVIPWLNDVVCENMDDVTHMFSMMSKKCGLVGDI